ncbi:Hsp20/alpha crystallin family protein [Streptomyces sp. NPDC001339]|uniref:Hsp20/alpha crystallin family protein n=1 Tax=Streptomyces sp. NPDC001339 TaxID=3364563 RepID=UPI0036C31D1B
MGIPCELPGLKREDIDVEVSWQEVYITGEVKEREGAGVLRRATRRTGRFEYRALLSAEVKSEEVSASLSDGILTVTIPRPHHVEVAT